MAPELALDVQPRGSLSSGDSSAIADLCSQAFEEDYAPYLEAFVDPVHVLAKRGGKLVSHALWITRWLQIGDSPLLRTAYVEGVATDEAARGRGYASTVMAHLAEAIVDYDIGGLSPAETTLYARLGWNYLQGLLYARTETGLIPQPGEGAMILRLPNTPEINLHAPASIEWRQGEVW